MSTNIKVNRYARLYGFVIIAPDSHIGSELVVLKVHFLDNNGNLVSNYLKSPFYLPNPTTENTNSNGLNDYYPPFELIDGSIYSIKVGSSFYLLEKD